MEEIWKDIKGYEGYYQVSNLGRVKSLERIQIRENNIRIKNKEKILKHGFDKYGYYQYILCVNKKKKGFREHRLVAEAFIPNPNNYPCINHKDENKLNNHVDNLEWCDVSYNNNYGDRLNIISKNNKRSKKILQYSLKGELIKEWDNSRAAQIEIKLPKNAKYAIQKCCRREMKSAYGYIWKYKEENNCVKD